MQGLTLPAGLQVIVRDWLNANLGYIKTGHSREKIRQWFKKQERAENIERGREVIDKELRRLNLSLAEHGKQPVLHFGRLSGHLIELGGHRDRERRMGTVGDQSIKGL